jgi:hypothetical protein
VFSFAAWLEKTGERAPLPGCCIVWRESGKTSYAVPQLASVLRIVPDTPDQRPLKVWEDSQGTGPTAAVVHVPAFGSLSP